MSKRILILLFYLIFSNGLIGQNTVIWGSFSPELYDYRIRNIMIDLDVEQPNPALNFNTGILISTPMGKKIHFESGLLYAEKNFYFNLEDKSDRTRYGIPNIVRFNYYSNYIEIPAFFRYYFFEKNNMSLNTGVGLKTSIKLNEKEYSIHTDNSTRNSNIFLNDNLHFLANLHIDMAFTCHINNTRCSLLPYFDYYRSAPFALEPEMCVYGFSLRIGYTMRNSDS